MCSDVNYVTKTITNFKCLWMSVDRGLNMLNKHENPKFTSTLYKGRGTALNSVS